MSVNLSDKYILQLIQKYAQTTEGKEKIKSRLKKGEKFSPYYGVDKKSGETLTIEQMRTIARDMADILYKHIITDTASNYGRGLSSFDRKGITIGTPTLLGSRYEININLSKSSIHRDSLIPAQYSGIDDIIRLFITGYSAKEEVWGNWKTHGNIRIKSLKHRSGSRAFFDNAINEFNAKYVGKAKAYPSERYR